MSEWRSDGHTLDLALPGQSWSLRQSIRHSWLENQVLNKTVGDVVELAEMGPWSALDDEFPVRCAQARELVERVSVELSPARLVDRLEMFADRPDVRNELREIAQQCFESSASWVALRERLGRAVGAVSLDVERVAAAWPRARQDGGARTDLAAAWTAFLADAADLHDALGQVPRSGVWW